ncbi:MAG TPA: kynureninase [Steroidobacteraceae bacterium]|nr:kynureninase [Steroidobacteraceae bacterium]
MMDLTRDAARRLDAADELRGFRDRFVIPPDLVYLDGNSLGALPRATVERVAQVTQVEWGADLVRSWNVHDWIRSPMKLGAKVSGLIGASPDEVVVADTTSVNLFRLVMAALSMQTERCEVLSETGNFPTDLYVCEGATGIFGRGRSLRTVQRARLLECLSERTALVVLTHIHYKTSEVFDLAALTRAAHERGALILWDLSHSAGALPVDLNAAGADFAIGCGYKYLNGGPGAPAFLYVAQRHQERAINALAGWHGHDRPFDFVDHYVPARGIRRFLTGTPPIIASAALEVGVDLVLEAGIERLAAKSRRLSEYFIALVESLCAGHDLELVSPRQADQRGSHVSFAHPHGYEIVQALISEGVIGDFRAPDVARFGFTPLYIGFEDVWIAADKLRAVLEGGRWRDPRFAVRSTVT